MCKIIDYPIWDTQSNDRTRALSEQLFSGVKTNVPKASVLTHGEHLKVPMRVRCVHADGRSDEYEIVPGAALNVDEDASLEILNATEVNEDIARVREEKAQVRAAATSTKEDDYV